MAAQPRLREPLHHQVREAPGHAQQPVVAQPAGGRDGGLHEVAEVVQLVPQARSSHGFLGPAGSWKEELR
ncbi:hypothetical protein [Nonomuraea terrae]|uniref:hypothetical protein n=1 Tax=Nonomuraea terrae TaxID=2530383 RepID=UPI001FE2981D|nr:hypothetical protein [Nonomuraea terrae]